MEWSREKIVQHLEALPFRYAAFKEEDHPRDEEGKFSENEGAGKKKKEKPKTDKYEIAANIGVAGLENFHGVMDAKTQRQIFGANIFGKKTIRIDATGQGKVTGSFKVAFGQDFNTFNFSFEEIAKIANGEKRATW